ncbi:uncharacterized protein LOC107819711 [Nicotiana tabacum]|uniref:Uncharacterized protein LOC107819711 n=2 Tax=Nicotiana TaxID=4085 RepID=A0A1S4CK98_TOBAC|nr:PREDICTED: uncharacterized protein LOC104244580 [Nicotiana sylvestris]XP_016501339.1 PREDICTED: uncharacterized protein LOC107819711 [Nicotiana tabacum]
MTEDTLAFSEEDLETLAEPHNDVLVISFLLSNIRINRVLVDPGSSANVIRSKVVEHLGLLDQIIPASQVLHVFNMASKVMKGEIALPVDMSGTIQNTKFHVISGDMRYNALLGWLWIHSMRAIPSTLHQMIKFPTKDGITTIYGEHHAAKEMFAVYQEALNPIHSTSDESGSVQTPEDEEYRSSNFRCPRRVGCNEIDN